MKFEVKDEAGQYFDIDAPEGYDIQKVADYATKKLGFKVKSVGHLDDAEDRIREAVAGSERKSASEVARHTGRVAELEAEVSALKEELREERMNSKHAIAEERAKHEETRKLRMKALSNAETSAREALMHTLAGERKAREDAEKRAVEARPVIVENVLPDTPRAAWRIEVVSRDANGFVRSMEATPK